MAWRGRLLHNNKSLPVRDSSVLIEVEGLAGGEVVVVVVKDCLRVVFLMIDLIASHRRGKIAVRPTEQILRLDRCDVASIA